MNTDTPDMIETEAQTTTPIPSDAEVAASDADVAASDTEVALYDIGEWRGRELVETETHESQSTAEGGQGLAENRILLASKLGQ